MAKYTINYQNYKNSSNLLKKTNVILSSTIKDTFKKNYKVSFNLKFLIIY